RRASAALDASLVPLYPEIDVYKQMQKHLTKMQERQAAATRANLNLTQTLGSVQDLMGAAAEIVKFQGSSNRRQGQIFEATTSKFAFLMSVGFMQLAVIQLVVGLFFMTAFVQQNYPRVASLIIWERLAELAEQRAP